MMNLSYVGVIISDDIVNFMMEYVVNYFKVGFIWIVNMSLFINLKLKKLFKSYFFFNFDNLEMIK